jgi:hypothetical protein
MLFVLIETSALSCLGTPLYTHEFFSEGITPHHIVYSGLGSNTPTSRDAALCAGFGPDSYREGGMWGLHNGC